MLQDPAQIFALLLFIVCGTLWLTSLPKAQRVTRLLPAPIWIYLFSICLASMGVFPTDGGAYDAMSMFLVPMSLFLLTVSADFSSVIRIGHLAAIMLAAGITGILLGGFLAYLSVESFLAPDVWKGFAVLSGAWIGGSANAVAVQQGLDAAPSVIGPLLMVDSLMGYGWVICLIYLGSQQHRLARWLRYDPSTGVDVSKVQVETFERVPLTLNRLATVVGAALVASAVAVVAGQLLPELGDPKVISSTTWAILLVVGIGVGCSFTPLRRLEVDGASDIGYFFMLVLLASLGARGDFRAFLDAPAFLISGAVWLAVHFAILVLVGRLFRVPPVLLALGSAANIGGFVTAPIVAASFNRNMVPTALLMAAIAQVAGIYLPFALASVLAGLAQ